MRFPILVFHICAGISGLLSGAVAMSFRKGSRGHRVAGNVFVISVYVTRSVRRRAASFSRRTRNLAPES